MLDESVIEWAAMWVPEASPLGEAGQRKRFAEALRSELEAVKGRAAEAERTRIVAWLRERASMVNDGEIPEAGDETAETYIEAADAIEKGEHNG